MRKFIPKFTPATVIATIALVAAVGGTSYAATKVDTADIANNAITARQVENGTLRGKDFKTGGLTTGDVRDGKLELKDLSDNAIAGLKTRWLLLNESGQIEEQSGGFTVIDGYQTNNNVYIDSGSSMVGHGLSATVALQNKLDIDNDGTPDPSFNGQVSVGRCQTTTVECAPAGAKTENAFVVSPRQDDGTVTNAATRERVYVEVTTRQPSAGRDAGGR